MPRLLSTVACNLDPQLLGACLPLFESGEADAIEWSFDALYRLNELPEWFHGLIGAFSEGDRLIGHGIFFSLFSGKWHPEQQAWLKELASICDRYRFDHITEHFGFMTGQDFHHGAPLNIPYTAATLRIGQDRLQRIAEACGRPVGLENLAFSYSADEVRRHGDFLDKLLAPVNGFLILDLHNVYCQVENFDIDFDTLAAMYPLHRVREIHISGGSWEPSADGSHNIRRDTHDDAVPEKVFQYLERIIPQCPHLRYVVMEQLGAGLQTEACKSAFRADFRRMADIAGTWNNPAADESIHPFTPPASRLQSVPAEDLALHRQQTELSSILENAASLEDALRSLKASSLAQTDWQVEQWSPYMVETAMRIARKWMKKD
ncbi:DUF692 family multinuclear iron-containing protein [Chitinophaga caseinilytica]|uniref:DUF692 family multinuclear iron-containing protein n=1 Tax=Chitinophaga caseinilytica TaxID=2267521 RepID=A0ABZ2Z2H6_9BACT